MFENITRSNSICHLRLLFELIFAVKTIADALYDNYGYTEYLELGYAKPVYVTDLLIGENRGMGAVKNILAKDPMGKWMTLYSVAEVDPTVQALHSEFHQYRLFQPVICGTPFATSHLRFEMNTRTFFSN